jgi:hypothetical protein
MVECLSIQRSEKRLTSMGAHGTMIVRVVRLVARGGALFARWADRVGEARRRRVEHDRQFYRNLNAYCRANNISPVCEDDWRTWAGDEGGDEASSPKGISDRRS